MKRRSFLKYSVGSALLAGTNVGFNLGTAQAHSTASYGRTLLNIMLLGGADLRYLFVPDPTLVPEYAAKFWEARSSLYQDTPANAAQLPDYDAVWSNLYTPVGHGAGRFGIHNNAAWLAQQYALGNVAIVCNVLGSDNRRHDHSQLIVNTGDVAASQYVYDREGWGGRLVYAIDAANAVAVTSDISIFCNGIEPVNRNAKVVHAKDTRNFGLSPGDGDETSDHSVMARALQAYYAEKQIEAVGRPTHWPYRKFLQHEQALRTSGDAFNARLQAVAPTQPHALAALHTAASGNTLNSSYFGRQCANAYDSFLGSDLFQLRVGSMEYGGWDTHRLQKSRFEPSIEDVFGAGKGLATLTDELEPLAANDDIVYAFNTDFGRQLRANGDYGTDHGRGNYLIVVGRGVNGGVYGEMFPASEIQGSSGDTRYDQRGADIEGRTSFERVLAAVCDWVEPGTGAQVFPYAATSILESGVDLDTLFG